MICYLNYDIIGSRFRYTHYDKKCGEIYQSIEALDKMVRVVSGTC